MPDGLSLPPGREPCAAHARVRKTCAVTRRGARLGLASRVLSGSGVSTSILQRPLKVLHLIAAGVWLGALLAIFTIEALARSGRAEFGQQLAVYLVHEHVLFWAFVVTLVTGLAFSLFTPWGFARHWWIISKWGLALLLFGVTLLAQAPAIAGAVGLADAGVAQLGALRYADYQQRCLALAALQTGLVLTVFAISTIKPWGKVRRQWQVPRRWILLAVAISGALGIAFAAVNATMLHGFRTMPVHAPPVSELADGRYAGRARCGADYAVEAEISQGRITALHVTENRSAHYAKIAEAVTQRVLAAQAVEVDSITGATTSSRCLMLATANALDRAPRRPR